MKKVICTKTHLDCPSFVFATDPYRLSVSHNNCVYSDYGVCILPEKENLCDKHIVCMGIGCPEKNRRDRSNSAYVSE